MLVTVKDKEFLSDPVVPTPPQLPGNKYLLQYPVTEGRVYAEPVEVKAPESEAQKINP
jgi:hypothetical protein